MTVVGVGGESRDKEAVDGSATDGWHKTVCILCSTNCGVEVRLDGREITRVRGNKSHVASKGYTCEKALRLNHYQNANGRLTSPLRRESDGTYTEVDWDTAITEVADGFRGVVAAHGSESLFYYGGGGQGNHLCGAYGAATRRALGIRLRSNALAQEKTGEAWVDGRMFGTHLHGDFHHAEVSVFVGKNPWQSHGFDQARRVLKQIAADADRSMIVIDPRRSETAELADFHLQVRPGTDAFCIAALAGVLIQEALHDAAWLADNTTGSEALIAELGRVDVADFAGRSGVDEALIRSAARRLAAADSVAVLEDLGIEMAPNSTLVSYLQKLLWLLVGSFAKPGGMTTHSSMVPLFNYSAAGREPATPVTGSAIISGLVPCNEIPELVLSDHPDRVRAMFIESANPVHSLASSDQWREVMEALEFSVVIDVAMTETARLADYVLPASSQYEKTEATFFNLSFPENTFTVRAPILGPLEGTLSEAEIHRRLLHELGVIDEELLAPLKVAAAEGRNAFADALGGAVSANPELAGYGAVVLYETLGPTLPEGMAEAAPLWFSAQQVAMKHPEAVRAAGHADADALFDAMVSSPDGVIFTRHDYDESWTMLSVDGDRINLDLPELVADLAALADQPVDHRSDEYPWILSAGERRSFTANTIMRDPSWRKRDPEGALRLSPADAAALGVESGSRIRITTPGGTAVAVAEVNDTMLDGHVSLPNGLGLDYSPAGGNPERTGVAPNELTSTDWRDPYAGTPWHKHVPARLEAVT